MINFEPCPLQRQKNNLFKLLQADLAISILIHHPHITFHIILGCFKVHLSCLFVGFLEHFGDLIGCQVSWLIAIKELKQSSGYIEPCSSYFSIWFRFGFIPAYTFIYDCSTVMVVTVLDSYLFELWCWLQRYRTAKL